MRKRESAALLCRLIENERAHEAMLTSGCYTEAVEERRNDVRAELESKLFALPTGGVADVAAMLQAMWPDLSNGKAYGEPPDDHDELVSHRLWNVIQGAKDLATDADDDAALGDAISVMESKAESFISMPVEVGADMLEAGARMAGISPDQARAFYEGVVSAFRERRVA